MTNRSISISEARRRLPELVHSVWRTGGRIDVTHHGQVRASIVRPKKQAKAFAEALRVEIVGEAAALPRVVRELRARAGRARRLPARRNKSR